MIAKMLGLAALLASAPLLGAPHQEPQISCEARVIHALHDGGGIDPQITRVRPYLTKPPFTAWSHFKLLAAHDFKLDHNGARTFELPNGRQATLTYVQPIHENGKERLRLRLQIVEGKRQVVNTVFVLNDEGIVLQGGQHYEAGVLILGISCDYPI